MNMRNKKALYEQIMKSVAKEVKKSLNESADNDDIIQKLVDYFISIDFDIANPKFKKYLNTALGLAINQVKSQNTSLSDEVKKSIEEEMDEMIRYAIRLSLGYEQEEYLFEIEKKNVYFPLAYEEVDVLMDFYQIPVYDLGVDLGIINDVEDNIDFDDLWNQIDLESKKSYAYYVNNAINKIYS